MRKLKSMMARFEETRDLRLMGGYRAGTDPAVDEALRLGPRIEAFLAQRKEEPTLPVEGAFARLEAALDSVRLPATAALAVAEREAAARRDTQRLVEMLRQAPVTLPDPAWVRYTPRR